MSNTGFTTLKCPTCGQDIVWCGENDIPDGRMENTYRCKRCGTTFTSLEPSEEDKLDDYYTHVLFINGYRKDSPRIEKEIESITIGKPKKGLCPDKWLDTEFFIIKFK